MALSRETLSRSHLPAAHPLLCYSVGILQSLVSHLHRPRSSVLSCSGTSHDLPLCNSNTFSDSRLSLSQTIRSLRPCNACSLFMLFGCTPICTGTRLLSMYCCVLVISRFSFRTFFQLAILVLSQMIQASTRPSSILSTFTSVMMSSITVSDDWLSSVGTSSLELCRYVVFASARQHVPQESNKPWLPFSHELPSPCEHLAHTCIATPVQCLHHHEYVVHLRAERSVESRCRRFFCRRGFQPVPLVHGSEI